MVSKEMGAGTLAALTCLLTTSAILLYSTSPALYSYRTRNVLLTAVLYGEFAVDHLQTPRHLKLKNKPFYNLIGQFRA